MSDFHTHLFSFDEGSLELHENLMTCVIVGLENPVSVAGEHEQVEAKVVCIRAGVAHRVQVQMGGAEIIYLDGVVLDEDAPDFTVLGDVWHDLPGAIAATDHARILAFRQMLHHVHTPPDVAVMQVVKRLYDDPFERLTQFELADALKLERTLAMRHFKATTGQTFRKFKTWAAMIAAVQAAHNGHPIGVSGINAGFSDAAHLTRTASVLFGITPTTGLSGLKRFLSVSGCAFGASEGVHAGQSLLP